MRPAPNPHLRVGAGPREAPPGGRLHCTGRGFLYPFLLPALGLGAVASFRVLGGSAKRRLARSAARASSSGRSSFVFMEPCILGMTGRLGLFPLARLPYRLTHDRGPGRRSAPDPRHAGSGGRNWPGGGLPTLHTQGFDSPRLHLSPPRSSVAMHVSSHNFGFRGTRKSPRWRLFPSQADLSRLAHFNGNVCFDRIIRTFFHITAVAKDQNGTSSARSHRFGRGNALAGNGRFVTVNRLRMCRDP
jgi:hypothetical protein